METCLSILKANQVFRIEYMPIAGTQKEDERYLSKIAHWKQVIWNNVNST